MVDLLEREEKESLFDNHIKELSRKNKEMFHKLLKENNVRSKPGWIKMMMVS